MKSAHRTAVLCLALVALAAVAAYLYGRPAGKPPPDPERGGVYYTGPMRNKGNPQLFTTEAGQVVAPPPGTKLDDRPSMAGPMMGGPSQRGESTNAAGGKPAKPR